MGNLDTLKIVYTPCMAPLADINPIRAVTSKFCARMHSEALATSSIILLLVFMRNYFCMYFLVNAMIFFLIIFRIYK